VHNRTGRVSRNYKAQGEKLKIGAITSEQTTALQFQCRDILWGFSKLGWETELKFEHEMGDGLDLVREFAETLDVLLVLSGGRWSVPEGAIPPGLPIWTYDADHAFMQATPKRMGADDKLFVQHAHWEVAAKRRGLRAHYLPPGVNTDIFKPLEGAERSKTCGFVAHHYPGRDTQILESLPPDASKMFRSAYKGFQKRGHTITSNEHLAQWLSLNMAKTYSVQDVERIIRPSVLIDFHLLCHYWSRHQFLEQLVSSLPPDQLLLWGSGFESYPDYHAGRVAHGPDLNTVYNSVQVVFYQHFESFAHGRLFEAAASGATVIAPPAAIGTVLEFFPSGEILQAFSNSAAVAMAKSRLEEGPSSESGAHQTCLEKHTWKHRAEKMCELAKV